MFFFHRRGVGGGKMLMENSITFNGFFIETFPDAPFYRHISVNHNFVAKLPISHRKYNVRIMHFCRDPQEAAKKGQSENL